MNLTLRLKFFPLWFQLWDNQLFFHEETLEFCDVSYWGYELFRTILDVEVGIGSCTTALYEHFVATPSPDAKYSCDYEYTYLHDIVDTNYEKVSNQFLIDTCSEEEFEEVLLAEEGESEAADELEEEIIVDDNTIV